MKEMHKFQIATAIFMGAFFTLLEYKIKKFLNDATTAPKH